MLAVMNENALDEMERKAKASAGTRKASGEATGGRAFGEVRTLKDGRTVGADEDVDLVVATWREAGAYFAAARLLNERGILARSGGAWYARTVQHIVNRADPATVKRGRRGVPALSPRHRLAGLLTCHCGAIMGQTVSGEGTPRYRCPVGAADKSHGQYIVSERRLMPWIEGEAGRLRTPAQVEQVVRAATDETAALEEDRRRVGMAFIDRVIDEPTYRERLAAIDATLAEVEASTAILEVPATIPWEAEPETVNAILRTLGPRRARLRHEPRPGLLATARGVHRAGRLTGAPAGLPPLAHPVCCGRAARSGGPHRWRMKPADTTGTPANDDAGSDRSPDPGPTNRVARVSLDGQPGTVQQPHPRAGAHPWARRRPQAMGATSAHPDDPARHAAGRGPAGDPAAPPGRRGGRRPRA